MLCPAPPSPCPFLPLLPTTETCTGQDLADLGDRLRDWFQLLHENAKQNGSASSGASLAGSTEAPCCTWGEGGQGEAGVPSASLPLATSCEPLSLTKGLNP